MGETPNVPGIVPSPTGAQWLLSHGDQRAVVVEVGGGLRTYAVGGQDVVAGFGAHQQVLHGRGQTLMPWPNRVRDGRYTVDG
ncbi:MAG: galactose mutarotase, partial [Nostocoides sp.]